jgi:hypothetical protein
MSETNHPTAEQRRFFERHILEEERTILTVKRIYKPSGVIHKAQGFSANIRGPFKLVEYWFGKKSEVVIDASWAGDPESLSHLHCYWKEVKFRETV